MLTPSTTVVSSGGTVIEWNGPMTVLLFSWYCVLVRPLLVYRIAYGDKMSSIIPNPTTTTSFFNSTVDGVGEKERGV